MDEFIHVLGTLPSLEEFKQQVEKMFQALDSHIQELILFKDNF